MNEEERYKLEKELWVSNLTGSTLEEIIFVVLIIPIAAYFHRNLSIIIQRKCTNIVKDKHKSTRNAVLWRLSSFAFFFLIDYVSIVLPMILCLTFTQYIWILHVILFGLDLCWKLFYTSDFQNKYDDQLQSLNSNKKLFLNVYRSSMMLLTCIAILAVDFRIFPRKFAKTETYGISLMDVGVGSFVISSALVSQKAREGLNQRNILNKSVSNNPTQILSKKHLLPNRVDLLISTLRSIALLLFLGVSRFIIVKTLNYQEHITEYGVHWNFFLTLALVTLFVAVLNISPLWSGTVGLLLLCVYQVLLSHFGVAEYIINAERTNFFNQNREGILSLIGYIALFLIGTQIGYYVMRPKTYRGWWLCVCELIFGAIVCWLLGHIFEDFFHLYSSRRMVNVSYVLHVLCVNLLILALCLVVDLISSTKEHYDNLLTRMTSQRNSQLVVFLLANILTGVVNLSMRTLYASTVVAFFVINCYMIVVCLIAYVDPLKFEELKKFTFNCLKNMASEGNDFPITPQEVSNFVIIHKLIRTLQTKGLIVEGLFCTPAVETEVQQLRQKIKQEREGIDLSTISKSPYVFAEILLEHLSPPYLHQPLLTHQLYDAFLTLIQIRDRDMRLQYLSQLLEGLHPVYKTTVKQLLILLYNITNNATLNKTPLEKLIPIFGPIFLRPRKIMTYMQHDEPLVAKVLTELVLEHERLLPSEDKSKTTTTSPTKSTLHLPSSPTAEHKQPSIQHSTNNTFQSDIIQLHNPNLFHTIQSKTKKFYTIDEILTQQKTNQSDKNHTTNNQTKNTSSSHNEKEKEKTNDQETPSLSTSFTTLQKSEPNINDSTFEGVKREDEENQINLNSTLSSSLENANLSSLNSQQEEKEIVIGEGDDETVVVHLTEDDTNMAISDSDQISLISSPLSPKASPLSKEELITQNNDQVQESIQQPTHNNVFHTPPPAIVLNNEVPNQTSSSNTLSDNVQ